MPGYNENHFTDRVRASRKVPGGLDPSKGRRDAYADDPLVMACNAKDATPETVPALDIQGAKVSSVLMFPEDPRVRPDDILKEIDPGSESETGRGYLVVRSKRVGTRHLARWQVDAKIRQS